MRAPTIDVPDFANMFIDILVGHEQVILLFIIFFGKFSFLGSEPAKFFRVSIFVTVRTEKETVSATIAAPIVASASSV